MGYSTRPGSFPLSSCSELCIRIPANSAVLNWCLSTCDVVGPYGMVGYGSSHPSSLNTCVAQGQCEKPAPHAFSASVSALSATPPALHEEVGGNATVTFTLELTPSSFLPEGEVGSTGPVTILVGLGSNMAGVSSSALFPTFPTSSSHTF